MRANVFEVLDRGEVVGDRWLAIGIEDDEIELAIAGAQPGPPVGRDRLEVGAIQIEEAIRYLDHHRVELDAGDGEVG